jgi:hypothetical protein
MIICLYGPDDFRRREKLEIITAEYIKKHSALSVQSFDLSEDGDFNKLLDALSTGSLFDPFRLVRVLNAFDFATGDLDRYAEGLRGVSLKKDVIVAMSAPQAPPKAIGFLIKAPAIFQEFKVLTGLSWARFVETSAIKNGLKLSSSELNQLAVVCAGDGFCLKNEIEKLILRGGRMATADFFQSPEPLFQAVLRLCRTAGLARVPLLEGLLSNEDSAAVFNMLAALVSDTEKIRFADYDVAIKSGKLDYETALTDYALG